MKSDACGRLRLRYLQAMPTALIERKLERTIGDRLMGYTFSNCISQQQGRGERRAGTPGALLLGYFYI